VPVLSSILYRLATIHGECPRIIITTRTISTEHSTPRTTFRVTIYTMIYVSHTFLMSKISKPQKSATHVRHNKGHWCQPNFTAEFAPQAIALILFTLARRLK
jgi:hypothetical protein